MTSIVFSISPGAKRELTAVIDEMLAVIPPEEVQANASLVMGLLSIRDSVLYTPPEGVNVHWRRVLDVFDDAFGENGPPPGWPTRMCEIFRGGPPLNTFCRGHVSAGPPSPMPGHVRRSLQRTQIEQRAIYAHYQIGALRLHPSYRGVGYVTIALLATEQPDTFNYGLSICSITDQFDRRYGREKALCRLIAFIRHNQDGKRYPVAGAAIVAHAKTLPQGELLRGVVEQHLRASRERCGPKWLLCAAIMKRV